MGAGPVNALREEDEESEKPKKYTAPGQQVGTNKEARKKAAPELPVGFIAESKTAKRNKQRRQRKKNTGEEESEAAQQQQQQEETQGAVTAEDAAKKAKAIEKKLRQIAGLREKQAAGATLDADQLQKVAAEADLRDQLQKLKL